MILFMYGSDSYKQVWFKVKNHDVFSLDLQISHAVRFKFNFPHFFLKNKNETKNQPN